MTNKYNVRGEGMNDIFFMHLKALRLPEPTVEHRFHPKRKWRFDYAWPDLKVAVEKEGGAYARVVVCNHCGQKVGRTLKSGKYVYVREGGRHNTGKGLENDMEKYNNAVLLGWRLFRFTPQQMDDGDAALFLEKVFSAMSVGII